jgi:hypothetical protein
MKMDKGEFMIRDLLERCIKNMLHEQSKQREFFGYEFNFQARLYKELKDILKNEYPLKKIHITIEYDYFNFYLEKNIEIKKIFDGGRKSHYGNKKNDTSMNRHVIDIVILIDDEYYLIGLKLSEYEDNKPGNKSAYVGGTEIEKILPSGYKEDIDLFTKLVNEFDDIKSRYCILLCTENVKAYSCCKIRFLNINVFSENDKNTGYSYFIKECKKEQQSQRPPA